MVENRLWAKSEFLKGKKLHHSPIRFIQECLQRKIVRISYVATRKNISDMMTKQSSGPQFISHREFSLGYVNTFAGVDTFAGVALPLRGCCRLAPQIWYELDH